MEKQIKKDFIELREINWNTARTQFKYKRSVVSYAGLVLVGVGVLTLPLPTGSPLLIGLGLMLASPVKLKYSLRNIKEDIRFKIRTWLK